LILSDRSKAWPRIARIKYQAADNTDQCQPADHADQYQAADIANSSRIIWKSQAVGTPAAHGRRLAGPNSKTQTPAGNPVQAFVFLSSGLPAAQSAVPTADECVLFIL
jgi:hypothetical protein